MRMVTLKKSYAEITLKIAEAGGRSCHGVGALQSQLDLNAAKDETPRLLIRLKMMIDAKAVLCFRAISLWFGMHFHDCLFYSRGRFSLSFYDRKWLATVWATRFAFALLAIAVMFAYR